MGAAEVGCDQLDNHGWRLMARIETIQTEPVPSEWPELPTIWWKWFDDLRLLAQGREGRQNFINTLTDTKTNNTGIRTFFLNDTNGDAKWSDTSGAVDPYIGPNGELIVPTTIIATKRQITNVGACKAYQTNPQAFADGVASVMTYGTAAFDEDSAMDLVTGVFTPVQAGKYAVSATIGFDASQIVADRAVSISIYKSGSISAATQDHTSNNAYPLVVTVSDLVLMDGDTDYLEVFVQQDFGAGAVSIGNSYTCYFTAFKVD